jgi:ubiquinone/menaquinone biosynthesis C-methylase UbiE
MGWYDCFNFERNEFTKPDTKAREIHRVLCKGGRFVVCSWEAQEDLAWMEASVIRYYPDLVKDAEYIEERPIGMAYEKPTGYEIILRAAGFEEIQWIRETKEFVSTDEEEWWQQMSAVGWRSLFKKIAHTAPDQLKMIKESIFKDIQTYKSSDGIHFTKSVFYVSGVK